MARAILSVSIDVEIYKKLEEIAKKRKISRSKLVEEALKKYIKKK
jgi:metal-responsive CopG/Arc/MetJ family transcriptional regulator